MADGEPDPKAARKEAIKQLHKEGWTLSDNPNAALYYQRLGTAGVDYRTSRLVRTEAKAAESENARTMASEYGFTFLYWEYDGEKGTVPCPCHGDGGNGLDPRTHSNYRIGIVNGYQLGSTKGYYLLKDAPTPPHPNCGCGLIPYRSYEGDPAPAWSDAIKLLKQ